MDFVSKYRSGSISKVRALNEITSLIFEADLDEDSQDSVTGGYLTLLKEVEKSFGHPDKTTAGSAIEESVDRATINNNGKSMQSAQPNQLELDRAREPLFQGGESGGLLDPSSGITGAAEQGGVDDSNDDFDYRRKPRLNIVKLPWRNRDDGLSPVVDPILRETQRQLTLFSQDTKTVLNDLRIAANKPPFPSSEWENIIFGYPINLDKVFTSITTGRFDPRPSSGTKEDSVEKN